ncbi:hypothetical protein [Methanospirillum sp.]
MNNLVKDVIICEQCKKINEYNDLECLDSTYKCGYCSFSNPNEKQNANIIEYAKNSIPLSINYEIIDTRILIPEKDVLQFFNCSLKELLSFCRKKLLKREIINGIWRYDWISMNINYHSVKILLSPTLWYNSNQASNLLAISKTRLSTLRKKGYFNSNIIHSRYYYEIESLQIMKQKLNWPMKKEVMTRLGISEYKFSKMIKSNTYEVIKISNRWHVNI